MSLETLLRDWTLIQTQTAQRISKTDTSSTINYIAGIDVTFVQDYTHNLYTNIGIGSIVVVHAETNKVVYKDYNIVSTDVPYLSGFLGFREIEYATQLLGTLRKNNPDYYPDALMIDGSGYYHPRRCGFATQIGIQESIPTIGVCKTYIKIDDLHDSVFDVEREKGFSYLRGASGDVYGAALYNGKSKHPLYVSVGNMLSLETAIQLTMKVTLYKIPEPIRQADLYSREIARELEELKL